MMRHCLAGRGVLLVLLLLLPLTLVADCRDSTEALESMQQRDVTFRGADDVEIDLRLRIAETAEQRAAGMQFLCERSVRDNAMLFVFTRSVQHAFHMQNVHVALDILFLDEKGVVRSMLRMTPGSDLYKPDHRFRYALELLAGEAERLGLRPGMQLDPSPAE